MDHSIVLKSYGKINLGLDVLRRREDGYHEVRMIMQTVGLYDVLTMKKRKDDKIEMTCNLSFLPTDERNLVYKAVKLIKDKYHIKDVTWYSSNDARARVDGNGLVTTDEV